MSGERLFTRGFVFLMMALSFGAGVGAMKYWPRNTTAQQAAALAGTNQQPFKPLDGGAAAAAGHTPDPAELAQHVPAPIQKEIKHQGGSITAVLQAQGTVAGLVSEAKPIPTVPEPEGAWVGTAVQDRGGLPPLTSAHFGFDKTGLKVAWENKTEVFKESFVITRNPDDSVHGFSQLVREVDGVQEPIKQTGADFYIPASEVTRIAPLTKGDVGIGPFLDQHTGRTRLLIFTSKRWDRHWSTAAVIIPNTGYAVIGTYSWGSK